MPTSMPEDSISKLTPQPHDVFRTGDPARASAARPWRTDDAWACHATRAALTAAASSIFRTSPRPSVLIERSGKLLEANTAAAQLFAGPPTFLVDAMQRVHVMHLERWTPLALWAAEWACTARTRFPLPSPTYGKCELVFESAEDAGKDMDTLLVVVEQPRFDDPSRLRTVHGFTDAEARVAQALIRGASAWQIAQTSGVKVSTVRTQIQRLLQKTGCHRQTELLCKLLGHRSA